MNGKFSLFKRPRGNSPCPTDLSLGPERGRHSCSSTVFSPRWLLEVKFSVRLGTALISDDSVNSVCALVSLWCFKAAFYDSLANYFARILIKSCHKGICYLGERLPDRSQMAEKPGGRGDGGIQGGQRRRRRVKGHGLTGAQCLSEPRPALGEGSQSASVLHLGPRVL